MGDQFQSKRFSDIGILSYLKGKDINKIVAKFKEDAGKLDNRKKHEIRQKILSSNKLSNTLSVTGNLKINLNHTPYTYEDELSAVILASCINYHEFHIRYIAEQISKHGEFECSECKIPCQSTSEIVLNAFVASYFQKIKNYEGSTLIFKRQQYGSLMANDIERQGVLSQEKTIIASKESNGTFYVVQLKVLQIDNNDERLKNIVTQKIAEKIDETSTDQKSKLYEERQLMNSTGHFLTNLVCFRSSVRIRNPLIHKLCKPSDHKNRLILYSYEQIYSRVVINKRTVKCIFHPYCQNTFNDKNFKQMAIVVGNMHKMIYEQYKECVYGQYFSGMYQKNWHFNYAENMLLRNQKNRTLVKRYMNEIRTNVQELLITASLKQKKRVYSEISRCLQEKTSFHPSINFFGLEKNQKIIIADVGQATLCPVRCTNCKNLNAMDAYKIAYQFISNPQKVCPVCGLESKKKNSLFYQTFYLDLELLKFIFLQGHNKEIYYDIKFKTYFHKLSFFTGRTLKNKLKQENKAKKGFIYKSEMDVKLSKNVKYIPFIDRRCAQKLKTEDYNKHLIYINQNEKLKEDTYCPTCGILVRSDYLEYNEELQSLLSAKNNQLRWGAQNNDEYMRTNASILSIKYYNDIKNEYLIKQERKSIKFYWKNYEGTLIRYPIKFRSCNHSLQTAICDFTDILYQSKVEKANKFRCRYKQCNIQYISAQEVQRVSLDIYSTIEDSHQIMGKIINDNEYWIQYSIEEAMIIKTSKKFNDSNDDKTERELIEKYRNKYTDNKLDIKNTKELNQIMRKLIEDLDYTQQKIREDNEQFNKNRTFKHSQNENQFLALKDSLIALKSKKKRLQEQKQQLYRQQMDQNRKTNKTSNINFTKIIKMYQPQVSKLREKRQEQDPFANIETQDFSIYKTYGNLYPFKYPVIKENMDMSFYKQVQRAVQELKKKQQNRQLRLF